MKFDKSELVEAVEGLVAKGLIEKIVVDGVEKYRLTELGKQISQVMFENPDIDPSNLN